ncbi:hypothetical protein ACFQ77_06690 [Streptomyces virginiae]|uniref:hypothetical protein n=1 Tax=Streptomyces virginiae TaxID=1961 RepID=UPI0036D04F72
MVLGVEDGCNDLGADAAVKSVEPQTLFLAWLGVCLGTQLPDREEAQLLAVEVLLYLFQDPPAELLVAELLAQRSERGLEQPAFGADVRSQAIRVAAAVGTVSGVLEFVVLAADPFFITPAATPPVTM